MEIATDRILSAGIEPAAGVPQPPFMKGEFHMHLKSTDHRPNGQPPRNKCSPPQFFPGRNGAAAMTRSPARLPRVLALAALALAGAALGLFSPVQAQESDEEADTVAPVFESARTDGGYVIVTFSEEITVSAQVAYAIQQFDVPVYRFFKAVMDVTVDGHDDVLSDNDYISGNELWLQLSFAVSGHQELLVSYDNIFAENGGGILVDAAGNAVPFFSDQPVRNDARTYSRPDRAPAFELSTEDIRIAEGESGTYTVTLVSQPSEDLTVNVAPYQTVQSTPASLTFTPENWNTPQTVTVSTYEDDDPLDAWGIVWHYDRDDYTTYFAEVRVLVEDQDAQVGGL